MDNPIVLGGRQAEVSCVPAARTGEPLWPGEDQAFMYLRYVLLGVCLQLRGLLLLQSVFLVSFCNSLPVIVVAQKLTLIPSIPLGSNCVTSHLQFFPVAILREEPIYCS